MRATPPSEHALSLAISRILERGAEKGFSYILRLLKKKTIVMKKEDYAVGIWLEKFW